MENLVIALLLCLFTACGSGGDDAPSTGEGTNALKCRDVEACKDICDKEMADCQSDAFQAVGGNTNNSGYYDLIGECGKEEIRCLSEEIE